jgi:hypothetical protein
MLESLPESAQNDAVEHLRQYLEEITDELRWDESFTRTSEKLGEFARDVRRQIDEGRSEEMDFDKL